VINLHDVRAAAERIRPYVVRTPLEYSARLSAWLKLECFQSTGSFKLRGALNALLCLPDKQPVLTVSAGNHGLGVARAAQLTNIHATVVVPETASPAKVEALERSGTELLLHGTTYDEAESYGRRLARERDVHFVSAYNDSDVIAGGGTIALEILQDLPTARTLIVPAGGGGLISGVALAAHGIDPGITVYGVQSEASPALHAARKANQRVEVDVKDSLADGLSGNVESGSITFEVIQQHVEDIALVSEPDIAQAMRQLLEHEHLLVEGSAAVGPAALQRGLQRERPTVVVLTGRNVASSVLRQYVLDH